MAYHRVLAAALLCYAALGAVLRVLPSHLTDLGAGPIVIGAAVGAPAITGLVARPSGGRLADRLGPRAVMPSGAVVMAAGVAPAAIATPAAQVASRLLVAVALLPAAVVPGVVALGAGQALAVPALGLVALARVPPQRHGAAAGLFFAWFDAGVGLGGPAAGFLAHLGGPSGALVGAAVAVACTAPVTLLHPLRRGAEPLVN